LYTLTRAARCQIQAVGSPRSLYEVCTCVCVWGDGYGKMM
jgi:hypothetical protein